MGRKPLGPNDYFNRLASRVTAALSVPTAPGPLYDIDARLRPAAQRACWWSRWTPSSTISARKPGPGSIWPCAALAPVFGSRPCARGRRDDRQHPSHAAGRGEGRRRCSEDAGPRWIGTSRRKSALDVKLGPGGLIDLEFAIHVLQLTTHVGLNTRLEVALEALAAESLVPANIVDALKLLSRMLVMMRLVAPDDIKPTPETWQLVAEACGAGSWDELLAEHDAARQSIRELWTGSGKRDRDDQRRRQGAGNQCHRNRREQRQPRVSRPAAGALFLSQGRHLWLHPRGAGLHRAGRRFQQGRSEGRSASRATR